MCGGSGWRMLVPGIIAAADVIDLGNWSKVYEG